MLPISSRPDMNSRATGERSHRRRIGSCLAVSNLDGVIEDAYQRKQGSIGRRLIPVIENYVERRLAPHGADDGAEDGRHPQQRGEACTEADAAKRCKKGQNEHSQAKASDHLDRSQLSRQIRKLRQVNTLTDVPCAVPPDTVEGIGTQQAATSVRSRFYPKLSVRTGS
jgi:hypothetical protein